MCDESALESPYFQMIKRGQYNISFPNSTGPQVFNLAKTELSELKDAVSIFWNYPMHILTMIIETGYTPEQQAYAIALDTEAMGESVKHVYQILDGKEIEIKADAGKYMLESDSNGQVVVKLHSWPEMTTYGTYIRYDIIQK